MNREYVEVQLRQARHDFLVENWPPHLQRASKIERKLLELAGDPTYQLKIVRSKDGITYLVTPVQMNAAAREWMRKNQDALIAWVEHTNQINARIARLTAQLCEMETTE